MLKKNLLPAAIVVVVMSSLFVNCTPDKKSGFVNVHETFTHESFKERRSLKGTKLELGTVLAPILVFFHDSLLFVSADGLGQNLSVYNAANNYSPLGSFLSEGEGPEEMLSVSRMDFNSDGTFWAHDLVRGQLKKLELVVKTDTVYTIVRESVALRWPTLNIFFTSPDNIGITTQDINPLTRFYVHDMQGKRKSEVGEYPAYGEKIPSTALVEVFNGWASVHPDKTKFVLAYEWTDLVEFYNADFTLSKRIHGPDIFLPKFELKARGDAAVMRRKADLTKFAYQAATSSDESIFLLYGNGRTVPKDAGAEAYHYNTIVTLDWEGKPQYFFELDHKVISICVDWKKRIIYGLDRLTSEVYAFPY